MKIISHTRGWAPPAQQGLYINLQYIDDIYDKPVFLTNGAQRCDIVS